VDLTDAGGGVLESARLRLEPLRVTHADELVRVLADPALYGFTGGAPPTLAELRARFERQASGGPPDGSARWLNWVVRLRDGGAAIGTVQATVRGDEAEVAWVIGTASQGRGYAREAAALMVEQLRRDGAAVLVAHVHPEHAASMAIARALGLTPGAARADGEVRWERRL
jgi:RimJ/RimL family protein N-acetyltransferase